MTTIEFPTFLAHPTEGKEWAVSYFNKRGIWQRTYPPEQFGPHMDRKKALRLASSKRRFLRSEEKKKK